MVVVVSPIGKVSLHGGRCYTLPALTLEERIEWERCFNQLRFFGALNVPAIFAFAESCLNQTSVSGTCPGESVGWFSDWAANKPLSAQMMQNKQTDRHTQKKQQQ